LTTLISGHDDNNDMRKLDRWLQNYERTRTELYSSVKGRLSNKFDLDSMSWSEIREIPIPELGEGMTFGTSFEALRKSWFSYKRSRKDGFPASDVAFRILKIQKALGLPLSEFPELDSDWVNQELESESGSGEISDDYYGQEMSQEEIQLRKEEREDLLAQVGLDGEIEEW
jgi:hypothetical protein